LALIRRTSSSGRAKISSDQLAHYNQLSSTAGIEFWVEPWVHGLNRGGLRRPLRGAERKKPEHKTATARSDRGTRPCGQPSCPHHKGVDSRLRRFLGWPHSTLRAPYGQPGARKRAGVAHTPLARQVEKEPQKTSPPGLGAPPYIRAVWKAARPSPRTLHPSTGGIH